MSDPGIFPYSPITPPDDVNPALARWAYREFQDVSDALGIRPPAAAVLSGIASPFTLSGTKTIITGYPAVAEGEGFRASADPALGTITLPFTGYYELFATAAGSYTGNVQNEAALGFLRHPGGDLDFMAWPIATNKISGLIMNGTLFLPGNEGDVWSLGMYATTGVGTFTFTATEFFVEFAGMV